MARNAIEIVIKARDEASKEVALIFDQFGRSARELQAAADPSTQAVVRMDEAVTRKSVTLAKAARAVRGLALPLTSELTPALGVTGSNIVSVVAQMSAMTSGLGLVAAAAAGAAVVIGGQLVTAWVKAREAEAAYVKVATSFDVGKIDAKIDEHRKNLEEGNARVQSLRAQLARETFVQSPGGPSPGITSGPAREALKAELAAAEKDVSRLRGLHAQAEQARGDLAFGSPAGLEAASKGQAAFNAQLAQEALQLDQARLDNRIKIIAAEKAIGVARIAAIGQAVEAQGGETLALKQRFELAAMLIAAQRDLELRAIEETATARRQAVRLSGAPVEAQAEQQKQITREVNLARQQAEDKFASDSLQTAKRFNDERTQLEERFFSVKLALGERSLQAELARHQTALRAAQEGSAGQIAAMEKVAAVQARIQAAMVAAAARAASALSDLATFAQNIPKPEVPGPEGGIPGQAPKKALTAFERVTAPATDPTRRGILLRMGAEAAGRGEADPSAFRVLRDAEDLKSGKVTLRGAELLARERAKMAEEAGRDLRAGGSITPEQWRDVENLPRLREQVGAFGDPRAIELMTGLQPPAPRPGEGQPERPIFRGIGAGGEPSFQNEGPAAGFSQVSMPATAQFGGAAVAAMSDFGGAGKSAADSFAAELSPARGGEIGKKFMDGLAEKVKEAAAGIAKDLSDEIARMLLDRAGQSGF